ncbi:MAG: CDP-glycerol glycerophosphotransferase family protein [Bacteroidales bacterium]|nr:CDP-glycerol glycerophosphotransferase family protein [Bacteroidales bacterium]
MFRNLLNLLVFKFTPVRRNRAVFTAYNGKCTDSPLYISQQLHAAAPHWHQTWLVLPQYRDKVPPYAEAVDYQSLHAQRRRGAAQVLVDNVYCDKSFTLFASTPHVKLKAALFRFFYHKPRQLAFTTFHGLPLKKLGRDQVGNDVQGMVSDGVTMLCPSRYQAETFRHLTFDTMKMVVLGSPRNDMLFTANRETVRAELGLPADKRILLFAPSFRNDGHDVEGKNIRCSGLNQIEALDFDRLTSSMSKRFGGEWVVAMRFHYHVASMVDWEKLQRTTNGKILNANRCDDMEQYLVAVDALMSDVSSCMFDFLHTGRPTFVFFPDFEHYGSIERGLYLDMHSLPFPFAETPEQLYSNIEEFDSERFHEACATLLTSMGNVDDAHSAQRAVDYILQQVVQK